MSARITVDAYDFDSLWETLSPEVRRTLLQRGVSGSALEDLSQEAQIRLWQSLPRLALDGEAMPALRSYAREAAESVRIDAWRKENPRWRALCRMTRLILRESPLLDLWDGGTVELCGLAEWRGQSARPTSNRDLLLRGESARFRAELADGELLETDLPLDARRLTLVIVHFFRWTETPVPPSELRGFLAAVTGIDAVRGEPRSSREDGGGSSMEIADVRPGPEAVAVWRDTLRRFGRFVLEGRLDRCRRAATTLALEREALLDYLHVLPSELATALEIPPGRFFEEVWPRLPLSDLEIAILLGIPVGETPASRRTAALTVSNCRMRTRRDAWPKWFWESGRPPL